MASISVEKHAATGPVIATGFFLMILTFLPYLYTLPYYVNMILQASSIVFIGSHLSIPGTQFNQETGEEEEKPPLEKMTQRDVMKFPIYGSCALFGLYALFKLSKEWVNLLLGLYFTGLGVLALGGLLSPFLQLLLPNSKALIKTRTRDLPLIGQVSFNIVDLISVLACSGVGYKYYTTHHWCCNNLFGLSFAIRGIEMISLGSFLNGVILLAGLFIYDIFWVFGTDVMVTVAKSFQAPIKLVFPRDWDAEPGKQFSMLGLGDIVVPGLFIALMLRMDVQWIKVYFYSNFVAYILGLVTTVVFMVWFKSAQPALLYLVPAALLAAVGTGAVRGQLKELFNYKEEEDESKTNEVKQGEEDSTKEAASKTEMTSSATKRTSSKKD